MRIPLWVICCFFLASFNICSLCLIFVNLINMCLGVFRLGFILFRTLWVSWTWVIISFPILGKFSAIISWSIFSWSFFLSSSSGTPMTQMLGHLTLSQRSLRLSSFLLVHFCFFPSDSFISTILSSTSLILSSVSVILLFVASRVFLSHLLHYSLYIDSFLFLLGLCQTFLASSQSLSPGYLSVTPFWFQDFGSFSLSLFRILYQVDSLSLSLLFGGHFSCSFTCWLFLCLFILFILLSLGWPFCILAVCGVLFIVEFPHCGWGCTGGLSRFLG